MREMLGVTALIYGQAWASKLRYNRWALFWCTREFASATSVPKRRCGNLALVQDAHTIEIDARAGTMNLAVSEAELNQRRSRWKRQPFPMPGCSRSMLYPCDQRVLGR